MCVYANILGLASGTEKANYEVRSYSSYTVGWAAESRTSRSSWWYLYQIITQRVTVVRDPAAHKRRESFELFLGYRLAERRYPRYLCGCV